MQRKRLTSAHSVRPPSNQGLKVAAAVVVPLIVAAALIGLVAAFNKGDDASTPQTASNFQTEVDAAFKPLAEAVKVFLPKAQEFETGTLNLADFKGAVDVALPEFLKARDAIAKLERYKAKPVINRYFVDAADLYVETARIYAVAADPAAEALRAQLNLTARRVRTLGDRIYDRGRVVLDPSFYAPTADVEFRPPTEVPDWAAEGMAAGPPLAEIPAPAAPTPPAREPTCGEGVTPPCRAEQPEKEWESRVKKAGLPQAPDVVRALKAADAARLGTLAATYETKTRELMAGPDPKGRRERAAAVGLGLLTDGEAARLGQAAATLPEGDLRNRLRAVARRTLVVGDDILESDLGFRRSGLSRSLLKEQGL